MAKLCSFMPLLALVTVTLISAPARATGSGFSTSESPGTDSGDTTATSGEATGGAEATATDGPTSGEATDATTAATTDATAAPSSDSDADSDTPEDKSKGCGCVGDPSQQRTAALLTLLGLTLLRRRRP